MIETVKKDELGLKDSKETRNQKGFSMTEKLLKMLLCWFASISVLFASYGLRLRKPSRATEPSGPIGPKAKGQSGRVFHGPPAPGVLKDTLF